MSATGTAHRRASEFEPLALLHVVRDVARSSPAEDPRRVSTRTWDGARELGERFTDVPAARRICEHLRLPWEKIRELAFMDGHAQRIALGHALGDEQANWLTTEYSCFALRLIARRLGAATVTPGQYRAVRQATLGSGRGRRSIARRVLIPTAEQIQTLAGGWDEALAQAGLAPRHGLGGHHARVGPVPIVEVLDRCYEHHGTEPTLGELVLFARANGIPFPRKERGRPYRSYVKEWKDRRSARGLDTPDGPPPKCERPDYTVDVGAALPGESRAKSAWADRKEVVAWVTRYLDELKARDCASQRAYAAWARQQDGAPWASVLARHGGWVAVREEAWQRLGE
ncbi:MAG: hypothetical protein JOZ95_10525 [Solirubrobacterales bacterium]|nr:hypothetical protein [Solirubrobacterales bacterium]